MKLIGCEKYIPSKVRIIRLEVPILISDKLDFKANGIIIDKIIRKEDKNHKYV